MVQFFVAGRADSAEYVICERILGMSFIWRSQELDAHLDWIVDIMGTCLPDVTIEKKASHPDTWQNDSAELRRLYG